MAKTREDFPPKKTKYPWKDWMNGQAWVLKQGVDFKCKVTSLTTGAHHIAKRSGRIVHTRVDGDEVTLKFIKRK